MSKINPSLFGDTDFESESCPECGSQLKVKSGASGPFLSCSTYPKCSYTKSLRDTSVEVITSISNSACPKCNATLQIKKGRFGLFIGCSNHPECDYHESIQERRDTSFVCPKCRTGELIEKTNRFGKQFFGCSQYPKCRFILNSEPVEKPCPRCDSMYLIKQAGKLTCIQKGCDYSTKDTDS